MIRFFALLPRRPDIDRQRFHDHWRYPHGTLGRQIPGMLTYVPGQTASTSRISPNAAACSSPSSWRSGPRSTAVSPTRSASASPA